MKYSVFGQRNIGENQDEKFVVEAKFWDIVRRDCDGPQTFIHGGAKGPQDILMPAVTEAAWDIVKFVPWTMVSKKLAGQATQDGKFDPVYFFFRNIQIVDNSDAVILFDNGTKDSEFYKVKNLVERKNVKYYVVEI